jgi:hypothetical protein
LTLRRGLLATEGRGLSSSVRAVGEGNPKRVVAGRKVGSEIFELGRKGGSNLKRGMHKGSRPCVRAAKGIPARPGTEQVPRPYREKVTQYAIYLAVRVNSEEDDNFKTVQARR